MTEREGSTVSEKDRSTVSELHGKELRSFKNKQRKVFAQKASMAYRMIRESQIPKVDRENTFLRVNSTNAKHLLSEVVNAIVISYPDPTKNVRRCLEMSDKELSLTDAYLKLKREMENSHSTTKKTIEEWIKREHMESHFQRHYDQYDEDDISDLPNDQIGKTLQRIRNEQPVPFMWMWHIYKEFRRETRPSPIRAICPRFDESKLTFTQYFRDSTYEFYTECTQHYTYHINIVDFLRLLYRSILDVQPTPEYQPLPQPHSSQQPQPQQHSPLSQPQPKPINEVVAKVLLVSDEELLAFISELKKKHPTHTSVKSLYQHLKREKPEWQVTETRITKLLKKR
jgi:hypothetical protein